MIRVDLTGFQDIRGILNRINHNEISWIKRQMAIACINVQRNARINCPVDTGRLRSSIQFKFRNNGLWAQVYSDAFYACYVEWGTGIFAYFGNGRRTPWKYYYARIGTLVMTRGQKPKLMVTNAWNNEKPDLYRRIRIFGGGI